MNRPRFTLGNMLTWMTVAAFALSSLYIGNEFIALRNKCDHLGYRICLAESQLQEVARSFNDTKTVLVFREPYESNEEFSKRASEAADYTIPPTGRIVMRILLKDPEAGRLVACPNLITPQMAASMRANSP